MFTKLLCLFFLVGLAAGGVIEETIENKNLPVGFGTSHDYASYVHDPSHPYAVATTPESTDLLGHVFHTLAAYKSAALGFAVKVIGWVVRNIVVIAFGALATIGFCKFTHKCSLNYKYYDDYIHFRSLVTPERLASAEKFLMTAVEKYASEIKREKQRKDGRH